MQRSLWFVEVASERAAGPRLRPAETHAIVVQAARQGVGIRVTPDRIEATFNIAARDFDMVLERARRQWASLIVELDLPCREIVHLSIDRTGSPRPSAGQAARRPAVPWTRPSAAVACTPVDDLSAAIFDIGARADVRHSDIRMRSLVRSDP